MKKETEPVKQPDQRWRNYSSPKLSKRFARMLQLIAAHTGETMIQVADRLAETEWERVKDMEVKL